MDNALVITEVRSVNAYYPFTHRLHLCWACHLGLRYKLAVNPGIRYRRVVVDINFLCDDNRVKRALLFPIPLLVLARVILPMEREHRNASADALTIKRVAVAVWRRYINLAIRCLRQRGVYGFWMLIER